jgi:hypothetical protein
MYIKNGRQKCTLKMDVKNVLENGRQKWASKMYAKNGHYLHTLMNTKVENHQPMDIKNGRQ